MLDVRRQQDQPVLVRSRGDLAPLLVIELPELQLRLGILECGITGTTAGSLQALLEGRPLSAPLHLCLSTDPR